MTISLIINTMYNNFGKDVTKYKEAYFRIYGQKREHERSRLLNPICRTEDVSMLLVKNNNNSTASRPSMEKQSKIWDRFLSMTFTLKVL